ncbi:DUF1146 family protein [Paenibacillus marinisediminis]
MDNTLNEVTTQVGIAGLVQIIVTLCCIAIAWWSLKNVKLDLFIRHPKDGPGKMLHILLAIVLGRAVSLFFLDYWDWAQSLKYLF